MIYPWYHRGTKLLPSRAFSPTHPALSAAVSPALCSKRSGRCHASVPQPHARQTATPSMLTPSLTQHNLCVRRIGKRPGPIASAHRCKTDVQSQSNLSAVKYRYSNTLFAVILIRIKMIRSTIKSRLCDTRPQSHSKLDATLALETIRRDHLMLAHHV